MYCLDWWETNKACIYRKYRSELFHVDYCRVLKLHLHTVTCILNNREENEISSLLLTYVRLGFSLLALLSDSFFSGEREKAPHRYELL